MRTHLLLLSSALLLAACRIEDQAGNDPAGGDAASPFANAGASASHARFATRDDGAVPGGPGRGERYAVGRPASAAEVAAWDFDIGPDGAALPPGRGTAAAGEALYAAQCAMCHGAKGEGIAPFPALIGRPENAEGFRFASDPKLVRTIGNYWSHATTVFDYIKRAMPLTAPGSLTDDQVYALTAYLLAANKVIAADATLDAESLKAVEMPYADRFVADDRRAGPGPVK